MQWALRRAPLFSGSRSTETRNEQPHRVRAIPSFAGGLGAANSGPSPFRGARRATRSHYAGQEIGRSRMTWTPAPAAIANPRFRRTVSTIPRDTARERTARQLPSWPRGPRRTGPWRGNVTSSACYVAASTRRRLTRSGAANAKLVNSASPSSKKTSLSWAIEPNQTVESALSRLRSSGRFGAIQLEKDEQTS